MAPVDDRHNRSFRPQGLASGALAMLTREAVRMPLLAVTVGLQAWQRTRGVRDLAVRRGGEVLQIAAHTPLGRFLPHPLIDDGADEEAGRIATAARRTTAAAESASATPAPAPKPAPAPASAPAPAPASVAPSTPVTTPKPEPSKEAVEMGAPGAVSDKVDDISAKLHIDEPTSRDELPIPDFDNVSLGSLRARLRSLSVEQLVTLREWEQAHAHRLPVITLLDNRIAKVSAAATASAYPADGGVAGGRPSS